MPSIGSKVIKVSKEDKEHIERLMKEYGLTWSGAVHMVLEGFEVKHEPESELMDRAVEKDLVRLCRANGITTHDFFRGVMELFTKHKIKVDMQGLRTVGDVDTEKFEETCYKNKLRPQEVLDKLTRRMRGIRD